MSEIKPMNLSGVSHNPLQGGAASGNNTIADRMRANSQLRMAESMNKYKQAQMKRAENDYQIGKKTENFVFSNYPSGKDSTWANGTETPSDLLHRQRKDLSNTIKLVNKLKWTV